jgi:hypothetical protein
MIKMAQNLNPEKCFMGAAMLFCILTGAQATVRFRNQSKTGCQLE